MIVPFLVYWFVLFVAFYILVENGHRYLYDELPKHAPVRVVIGSLLLAALLTWTHSSFDTMFTSELKWTVLQAMAWTAVFVLVFAFQPIHGLGFAVAVLLLVPGIATIAVDTMTKPGPAPGTQFTAPRTPLRRPAGGAGTLAK